MITIDRYVLKQLSEWADDYAQDSTTVEIRLNFSKGVVELYDYQSGVVESERSLQCFD